MLPQQQSTTEYWKTFTVSVHTDKDDFANSLFIPFSSTLTASVVDGKTRHLAAILGALSQVALGAVTVDCGRGSTPQPTAQHCVLI